MFLPPVLTGYDELAADGPYLFVGSEGKVTRVRLDDPTERLVVFEAGMGPLAAGDGLLFVADADVHRMQPDGSGDEILASTSRGPMFVDGGYIYFTGAHGVVRLPVAATPGTEPEPVAETGNEYYVAGGILTAPLDGGILRRDLTSGTEIVHPYPAGPRLFAVGADDANGYVLGGSTTSSTLYGLPHDGDATLPELTTLQATFWFTSLHVHDGRALFFLPRSNDTRDYASLYVWGSNGELTELGNGRIPQPTDLVVTPDHVYVSAFGTSGLAGDVHRLGTVMRFLLPE